MSFMDATTALISLECALTEKSGVKPTMEITLDPANYDSLVADMLTQTMVPSNEPEMEWGTLMVAGTLIRRGPDVDQTATN